MSEQDLIDFGIWREMDEDLSTEEAKQEALAASQRAIAELSEEDVEVEWVRTDVLEDTDGDTDCAYCHYRAPSEEAIAEHSERAGLPVTELTRLDDQFDRNDLE
ncbi:nickel-binding protein [Natrinema amylolyticum]|uniref:nickel-binding protein n=1 Tax=Natrinema amylolyticum TaxID=2878679 RepID=UPI001CFBBFDE|nr:nickel-binding protein [Natrinema amylolyticum]